MRIISGKYKGRRLLPPPGLPVRPTTDFAREGLFNVLNNQLDFETLKVLDLFSGTGSMAFEFLSRGAREVVAVDISSRCIDFIRKSAVSFGAGNITAVRSNAFVFIRQAYTGFDLIFADPPYDLEGLKDIPDMVLASGLFSPGSLLILEHPAGYSFEDHPHFAHHRRYGNVNFTFFR